MHIRLYLILVVVIVSSISAAAIAGEEIHWLTDLDAAKQKSLGENRFILADFWADWCAPCKRMNRKAWKDPVVTELTNRLVCLKIDTQKDHETAKEFGIRGIPTIMILDGYGTSILSVTGYKDAEQVALLLRALPESAASIHLAAGRLAEDPENLELQVALAYQYRLAGFYKKSNTALAETAEALDDESPPELSEQIQTFTALNHLLLGETKKAWKSFIRLVEDYPESEYRPLHLFSLVKAGQELKKKREVQEYIELLRSEFPDDKHTAWAEELMSR